MTAAVAVFLVFLVVMSPFIIMMAAGESRLRRAEDECWRNLAELRRQEARIIGAMHERSMRERKERNAGNAVHG